MADPMEKKCPTCGQQLRFPESIGGVLMACPVCGNRFYSDFKLGAAGKPDNRHGCARLFGMPYQTITRIARFFRAMTDQSRK